MDKAISIIILIVMMLGGAGRVFSGGRPYSLRLSRFDGTEKKVYARGDKFLPEEK
jgi:hypothetical protein